MPHSLSGSIKEKKMSFPCQEFNNLNNDNLGLIQACHQVILCIRVRSTCTVITYCLQSFTKSSIGMKHLYKIQTTFDTHTHTHNCTALCTKLFYPLSTTVNILSFQLPPCCTLYSSSDISHLTPALTTQVAAYKETAELKGTQ